MAEARKLRGEMALTIPKSLPLFNPTCQVYNPRLGKFVVQGAGSALGPIPIDLHRRDLGPYPKARLDILTESRPVVSRAEIAYLRHVRRVRGANIV